MTKLTQYESLIKETSLHTNIYSKKATDDLPRHIQDSITLGHLLETGVPVVDFGSGCGLPAIPICLSFPDLEVIAIESKSKKTRFLETVKATLVINNLTIFQEDIHIWAKTSRFNGVIIAKAFMPYPKLIRTIKTLPISPQRILVPTSQIKWAEWSPELKNDPTYTHSLIEKNGFIYIQGSPRVN